MNLKQFVSWRRVLATMLIGVLVSIALGIPAGRGNTDEIVGQWYSKESVWVSFDGFNYLIHDEFDVRSADWVLSTYMVLNARWVSRGRPLVVSEKREVEYYILEWRDPRSRPPTESELKSAVLEYVRSNSSFVSVHDLSALGVTAISNESETAFYLDCVLGGANWAIAWILGVGVLTVLIVLIPPSPDPNECPTCGYDLTGLDDGAVCPECGESSK